MDPRTQSLHVYRYRGLAAIKHTLLNDFNALNGHEMIHYEWLDPNYESEGPLVYRKGYSSLRQDQRVFLDQVAHAILTEDTITMVGLFGSGLYIGT